MSFNWAARGDQTLQLRGGTGIFVSRIPFAWPAYAYYNNGVRFRNVDCRPSANSGCAGNSATVPLVPGQQLSSLQTGVFAGPVGSAIGQHRFDAAAVVREAQPNIRLYTPRYGRIELRARASDDPLVMVALWLIGYEDEPERSGEICVCEIFGRDVGPDGAAVGVGVHPFGDPLLVDDFARVELPIDARELHVYAAEWEPDEVRFLVDGEPVKTVGQSPAYPMQLMLGIYEFPSADGAGSARPYPKEFVVDSVRGYRLTS